VVGVDFIIYLFYIMLRSLRMPTTWMTRHGHHGHCRSTSTPIIISLPSTMIRTIAIAANTSHEPIQLVYYIWSFLLYQYTNRYRNYCNAIMILVEQARR
jgi:hypothetical protein